MIPVIAYYTRGTRYQEDAKVLRQCLDALGIDCYLRSIPDQGSWQANTQYKAKFISHWMKTNMRIAHFVYLDVDAFVLHPMPFFDVCAEDGIQFSASSLKDPTIRSGTLFFANDAETRALVQTWNDVNTQYPETFFNGKAAWDQRTLQKALKAHPHIKQRKLPVEYIYILGTCQRRFPDVKQPIIVHTRGHLRKQEDKLVWYAFPSANVEAARKTASKWKKKGYSVIAMTDVKTSGEQKPDLPEVDWHIHTKKYQGWADAHNRMAEHLLKARPEMEIMIAGSDDVDPDPNHKPEDIVEDLRIQFGERLYCVMQPIGDKYGGWQHCAPHPWMGRGWLQRQKRPLCKLYHHLYADQEIKEAAQLEGVYTVRSDITQYHHHWGRDGEVDNLPPERRQAIKDAARADKRLFQLRKSKGFP